MHEMLSLLIVIACLAINSVAVPSFRSRRQANNAELEDYLTTDLESFRVKMLTGIPEIDLPPLEPYVIEKLDFPVDKFGFVADISVRNINIIGMSGYKDPVIEVANDRIVCVFTVHDIMVTGTYDLKGHISWLPGINIAGNGPVRGKVAKITTTVTVDMDNDSGRLSVEKVSTDMNFDGVTLELKELLEGNLLSVAVAHFINANAGKFLVSMKGEPEWLMSRIMSKMMSDALDKFDDDGGAATATAKSRSKRQVFRCSSRKVNSVLDNVIENARPFLKRTADPLNLPVVNLTRYFILHDGQIDGLSSIYRTGESRITCDDHRLEAKTELSLEKVGASYQWTGTVPLINYKLSGTAKIRVSDAKVDLSASQNKTSVGSNPVIDRMELSVKNVDVEFEGLGPFSSTLSRFVSILSNVFKDLITEAIQVPVKDALQQQFNKFSLPF